MIRNYSSGNQNVIEAIFVSSFDKLVDELTRALKTGSYFEETLVDSKPPRAADRGKSIHKCSIMT